LSSLQSSRPHPSLHSFPTRRSSDLLSHCFTVWIKARPEEHMSRVVAQGDVRPMAANDQAMEDLRRILEAREPRYRKADVVLDTSGASVEESFAKLKATLQANLQ